MSLLLYFMSSEIDDKNIYAQFVLMGSSFQNYLILGLISVVHDLLIPKTSCIYWDHLSYNITKWQHIYIYYLTDIPDVVGMLDKIIVFKKC